MWFQAWTQQRELIIHATEENSFGSNLTYVKISDGQLTYRKWIEGIKAGNTVISRNGHKEFLDLKVNNGSFSPGDEILIKDSGTVTIDAKWTSSISLSGRIEIIYNGEVIATQAGTAHKIHLYFLRLNNYLSRVVGYAPEGWVIMAMLYILQQSI